MSDDAYMNDARDWLRALLADRKQAQSESTARSLASQFRRVAREAENDALERAARAVNRALAEPGLLNDQQAVIAPGDLTDRIRSLKSPSPRGGEGEPTP